MRHVPEPVFYLDESIEHGLYISKLIEKVNEEDKNKEEILMNNPLNILMEEAIQLINRNKNIFISSHVQPDGDSVGSILALAMAVKALDRNKNVRIVK